MVRLDRKVVDLLEQRLSGFFLGPEPVVAEEELRDDVQVRRLGSAVVRGNANRNGVLFIRILGILSNSTREKRSRFRGFGASVPRAGKRAAHLNDDIPVPVLVENVRVGDFKLCHVAATILRLAHELLVRVCRLRVLVEHLHVAVRRQVVYVPVQLFDVLSVIALKSPSSIVINKN